MVNKTAILEIKKLNCLKKILEIFEKKKLKLMLFNQNFHTYYCEKNSILIY